MEKMFEFFKDICSIPHGSGNTKQISDYCVNFAKERGLWYYQDKLNNVIIKKSSSVGYENKDAIVLQGHLDMVCEKREDINFDFYSDKLNLKTDGDLLFAEGTTLGGDDGIAVAMALSILDDETLSHPPLEVVFTSDEETGMYGAQGLDASFITAKKFINIDSEDEGVFTVGCAGGIRVDLKIPVRTKNTVMPAYKVSVSGLVGGHSGIEINKNRLNANKVMGDFLKSAGNDILISSISGGSKDNAIPVNAECVVFTDGDLYTYAENFIKTLKSVDDKPGIEITPSKCNCAFDSESSNKIISLLCSLPNGVIKMSEDIGGLVETSLNIGVIKSENDIFSLTLSVRSSKSREKAKLINKIKGIAKDFKAQFSLRGDYPAWEYRKDSTLRDIMTSVYKSMYGKLPQVEIIHAGLECGIFAEKIEDIDAVSIGPDIFDVHTPRERLSISSAERTYKFICGVLEAL